MFSLTSYLACTFASFSFSQTGGGVQRTHHWSPLCQEVEFVRTKRDVEQASFICAKDRHVSPWVDVNVRFGIIKYVNSPIVNEKG